MNCSSRTFIVLVRNDGAADDVFHKIEAYSLDEALAFAQRRTLSPSMFRQDGNIVTLIDVDNAKTSVRRVRTKTITEIV